METRDIEKILAEYDRWNANTTEDHSEHLYLDSLMADDRELYDSFYREIEFGTSGLRGIMGLGPNRMNRYVVTRATRGLADYLNEINPEGAKVIISYDTRNHSREFARVSAQILREMGIDSKMFRKPTPVPVLSYAIRKENADMGIMITASHNPKIYNGYKVYNSQGHQIVGDEAKVIMTKIHAWDYFDVPKEEFEPHYLPKEVSDAFLDSTVELIQDSLREIQGDSDKNIKIVYTPLNGTGRDFVLEALKRRAFTNVITVQSQEMPDGNFPTCPVPNPEKIAAYNEAFYTLDQEEGDIIIATDPDCDRVGVAMYFDGVKRILTGNQIGILLFDFLCSNLSNVKDKFAMRSIVSTALFDKIAGEHGVNVIKTLTGFKYMGKVMSGIESSGDINRFLFAFEESNGYLFNKDIRDKDGIGGALLIAEMAAYYKVIGTSLPEKLDEIYNYHGQYHDKTENYVFQGAEGRDIMEGIMTYFRDNIKGFLGGIEILEKIDYLKEEDDLKEDILEFKLRDHGIFIIRPSGTEPKLKAYFFGNRDTRKLESEVGNIIDMFRPK